MNMYKELPLNRYVELYTSTELAQKYKSFEDKIIKQKPITISLNDASTLFLEWCVIDIEEWTGLAIHYKKIHNDLILSDNVYYDDSFYSYANHGIQRWSAIIEAICLDHSIDSMTSPL